MYFDYLNNKLALFKRNPFQEMFTEIRILYMA